MALNLPFGIKLLNKKANVDERYGPHDSKQDALDETEDTREKGLIVGIKEDGEVVDYQFKAGTTDSDLVKYLRDSEALKKDKNLEGLSNKSKARDNMQLGSAALQKDSDYLHKTTEDNRVAMKNDTALDAMVGKEFDNKSSPYDSPNDLINAGYTAENGYLQGSEIIMINTEHYTRYEKIDDDDLEWMVYTNADGWKILN